MPDEPVRPAPPAVRGAVDVAQGAYGQRGNLELIAPHAEDGFVVLWFNGDDEDAHAGALRRRWSGALHVPTGGRLDGTRIAQVPFGPDFLEALVRAEGLVERWVWRPDGGFGRAGVVGESCCEPSRTVVAAGALHVLTAGADGAVLRSADAADYPALAWRASDLPLGGDVDALDLVADAGGLAALVVRDGEAVLLRGRSGRWSTPRPLPGRWRSARLLDASGSLAGLTAEGAVVAAGVRLEGAAEEVAAVRSSLDGGTVEVVARRGALLASARLPPGATSGALEPVRPAVWPPRR